MKSQLHLAGLFVVHSGAQFIVRDKFVVRAAEGIENTPVVRCKFAPGHGSTDDKTHCETDFQIERAEEKDDKAQHSADKARYQSGNDGIVLGGTVNQIRLCFIHAADQRECSDKIKDELPAEQIKKKPATDKNRAGKHDFNFHKKASEKIWCYITTFTVTFQERKAEQIIYLAICAS